MRRMVVASACRRSLFACARPALCFKPQSYRPLQFRSCSIVQEMRGVPSVAAMCTASTPDESLEDDVGEGGVTVVDNPDAAMRALEVLDSLGPDAFHAVDTEVAHIDVTTQSPVGNGVVICASIYSGPDVDFGAGPRLWIDNYGDAEGTLLHFKSFLESVHTKKVYHNYGFDRHVLYNHGIDAHGLGADTMHMARVWTTDRAKMGGYSLESLTSDLLNRRKVPMKERFGVPKLKKDGTPGKEVLLPPVEDIQTNPQTRRQWIDYSTYDTEGTWRLHDFLVQRLKEQPWSQGLSMYDFYLKYLVPYAEVLTDMERRGIQVDVHKHLPEAECLARSARDESTKAFLQWVVQYCPDASRMNIGSDVQKAHLLFAPAQRAKKGSGKGGKKLVLGDEGVMVADATHWPEYRAFLVENTEGYIEEGKTKPKKNRPIMLRGLGMEPVSRTSAGWPAVSAAVLRELAGDPSAVPPKYGSAYEHFGGGDAGAEACVALDHLVNVSAIETMLSNFIVPLQQMADANGRVHCSLNMNTETGRLSARRPNLQNQPALEKDRFKIRKAFTCRPGNMLIVADYGQLELRLLAHMAKCESMINAFKAGGDFHSRTALGMYPEIAKAVEDGDVLLEWDDQDGTVPPPRPLLKDRFGSERRKAKVLNFSIAYGKTPMGLSRDWNVTLAEAKDTLEKWYEDRPEVRAWQQRVLESARRDGVTRTLMGRYRQLPNINSSARAARGHAERAAINTPIQGGASDVVMMAMLKVARNKRLEDLGWEMLLQIHDELIIEGPEESVEEALDLLVQDMQSPFDRPLLVDLSVDARAAKTWFDAK